MGTIEEIRGELLRMRDEPYRAFQSALMPDVAQEAVIGIRVPVLRRYAKGLAQDGARTAEFLSALPHLYHEENLLHGFLLETEKHFDNAVAGLEQFLPYMDDWSTCDCCNPRVLGRHRPELLPYIKRWLTSPDVFAVRYAIGLLMRYFLDADFDPSYPALVAAVVREEYYIRTMVAWYFATALAKQESAVLSYFRPGQLPEWTRKKAIRKALESYRISPEQKAYLRENG